LIRVRNIRALNGRFNTSITHAYSIVIGSKHITLNATGGGFLTASKQFRHGATSKRECHADYFDFERIEALKPAIEACGISTLSQSPMLGFHKQMDNRIKLLEEILSFRMQGVEFDN